MNELLIEVSPEDSIIFEDICVREGLTFPQLFNKMLDAYYNNTDSKKTNKQKKTKEK